MTFPFSEKVIGNISIKKNKIISILIVRDLVQHFSPIVFSPTTQTHYSVRGKMFEFQPVCVKNWQWLLFYSYLIR